MDSGLVWVSGFLVMRWDFGVGLQLMYMYMD